MENQPQYVLSVIEILLEEVEAEIDFVGFIGVQAFKRCDYDRRKAPEVAEGVH